MHPIRFRILMAVSGRECTTQQIRDSLPDVPQASLYRHLHRLLEAGILKVVKETPVRGAVEKLYAYNENDTLLSDEEMSTGTPDDYLRYFNVFVGSLLEQYSVYVRQTNANPRRDGVLFRTEAIYLSDSEHQQLTNEIESLVQNASRNAPGKGRKRIHLSRILIPDIDASPGETHKEENP